MNKLRLPLAITGVLLIVWGIWSVVFAWQVYTFSGYTVRHNHLTDRVEVKNAGVWTSLQDDPYAESLAPDKLPYLHIENIAWGPEGLLAATLNNTTDTTVQGRFALHLQTFDKKTAKRMKDRTLRINVTIASHALQAIALDTNLTTPDQARIATRFVAEPNAGQ